MKNSSLHVFAAILFCFILKITAAPKPPQPQSIPPPVGVIDASIDEQKSILLASGILLGGFFIIKRMKL